MAGPSVCRKGEWRHPGSAPETPVVKKNSAEQLLLDRARQGDRHAFDLLVAKYQQRVHRMLSRLLPNPEDAYDIAQETFLRAYQGLGSFQGRSTFYTWLYRIAINAARNHLAMQSRRPVSLPWPDIPEPFANEENLRENETPEHALLRDELQEVVIQAFEVLPEEWKTAITLREVEGLSYEEISEAMACPIGTVRSRIFRAREAISQRLQGLLEE